MDAALVGALCGCLGTALGAAIGYFGQLHVERRRQRAERDIRAENQTTLDLDRYVRARVVVDVWLDLLRRAQRDVVLGRLDLEQFEAEATRHSEELRLRLAELAHIRVMRVGTLDLFGQMRGLTDHIVRLESRTGGDGPSEVRRLGERIELCAWERNRWALSVLDQISRRTGLTMTELTQAPVRPFSM